MTDASGDLLFEVETPLGFRVRCTRTWWDHVTAIKHPAMSGRMDVVVQTLQNPLEVRQSRRDASIFLFYRSNGPRRWICVVAKQMDGAGFLVTTYPTDAIKEGDRIWPK